MRGMLFILCLMMQAMCFSQGKGYFTKYTYYSMGWVITDDNANASPEIFRSKSISAAFPALVTCGSILSNNIKIEGTFFCAPLNRENYGVRYLSPGIILSSDLMVGRMITVIDRRNVNFLSRNFLSNFAIEAYPCFGVGYTYRTLIGAFSSSMTINVGGGGVVWSRNNRWGVSLQSLAKFGLKEEFPKHGSNYIQTSASIIYKIKNWTDRRWIDKKRWKDSDKS